MSQAGSAVFAPEISCRVSVAFALYFQRIYGRSRLERAFARLNAPVPLEYVLEPANWMSFDFSMALIDVLTEEAGDEEFPVKAGNDVASPEGMGFAFYMFRALGTPRAAYERVASIGAAYNKVGRFEVEKLTDSSAVFIYRSDRAEPNQRSSRVRIGQLAAFPTVWGLPPARVRVTDLPGQELRAWRYDLTWQPTAKTWVPAMAGAAAGAALGLGLHVEPFPDHLAALLGAVAGGAAGLAWGFRRLALLRGDLLAGQDAGLQKSLGDLSRQVEEIRALNQTLEQRVEERTKELTLTSAKLQAALEKQVELDKAKTAFFQNISHELRTPLTLILAPLDSIQAEDGVDTRTRGQLDIMRRSAVRLLGLINSLLELSRLDAGKMRLALDDVDPGLSLRQLVESAQGLARQRGIRLHYQGPAEFGRIPLDTDKFDKCVLNLLSNALKFTTTTEERPAEIEVSAAIVEARLVVSVRDTGIGIPPEELDNIFARFHQVDTSDERRYGGTGIGLALVKELVDFHCGSVAVTSQPGVGSTFTLTLPTSRDAYPPERLDRRRGKADVVVDRRIEGDVQKLSQLIANPSDLALADIALGGAPLAELPPPLISQPGTDARPRVLVADDNRDMLSYLSTILARDYEVLVASDGEEAFQLAHRHLPACIVSDVMMPRKNGYALVRDLKKDPRTKSIPIVLVTAKADVHQKIAGIEYGADDYLTKPFNFLELRARIRQLLRARGLERSLAEKNEYLAKLNFDLVLSKKDVFLQTIEALAFALEAKDEYTHGHSRRVSLLSTRLAREMSLSDVEIERVRIAAVLHDIGKLGIPENILRKEGRLSAQETEIIQKHPEIGFHILESVRELSDVNQCILLHHERFDGSGYPRNQKAYEIPLESRIIAVTDTYDAMTSDRPYRRGLGHARAIEELRVFSGTQFDPEVVRHFLGVYEAEPPTFPAFPSVLAKLRA